MRGVKCPIGTVKHWPNGAFVKVAMGTPGAHAGWLYQRRERGTADRTGQRIGTMTAMWFGGFDGHGAWWIWQCDCGSFNRDSHGRGPKCWMCAVIRSVDALRQWRAGSCACGRNKAPHETGCNRQRSPRIKDLSGKRYGSLLVVALGEYRRCTWFWVCKCDCGAWCERSRSILQRDRNRYRLPSSCGQCMWSFRRRVPAHCIVCGEAFQRHGGQKVCGPECRDVNSKHRPSSVGVGQLWLAARRLNGRLIARK